LRIAPGCVGREISSILTADQDLAKKVFRGDRAKILREVARSSIQIPSCFDNWVFVMNHLVIHDKRIAELAPSPVQEQLTRHLGPDRNSKFSRE
jgi:hypothetical protein